MGAFDTQRGAIGAGRMTGFPFGRGKKKSPPEEDCLEELMGVAEYFGVDAEVVEALCIEGFSYQEIEEMLYDPELLAQCLAELSGRQRYPSSFAMDY